MEIEEQINYTILCNPYNLAKALLSKRQLQLPAKAGKPADLFTKHLAGANAFELSPTCPRQLHCPGWLQNQKPLENKWFRDRQVR